MKSIVLVLAVFALGLGTSSAFAVSGKQPSHPGHGATGATGPTGALDVPKGKANGWYCRNESKKHVPGQQGTPFSRCVTAMAKLKSGESSSPAAACAELSKRHTPGQPGTPFSRCVAAGAKLKHDQQHP